MHGEEEVLLLHGKVYTKGLDSVRKDYPPITSKLIEVFMYVVNTITDRRVMQEALTLAIGKVCALIMNGSVSNTKMMAEVRVKGASCYIYLSISGVMKKVQVENSSHIDDIDFRHRLDMGETEDPRLHGFHHDCDRHARPDVDDNDIRDDKGD